VRYSRNERNGEYTKGRMEYLCVIDVTQFSRDSLKEEEKSWKTTQKMERLTLCKKTSP
jgi:hypothetical protein